MADTVTANVELSDAWQKVAEDTEGLMLTLARKSPIAISFEGVDQAPTADGHVLDPEDFESRGFVRNAGGPPGFVYARTLESGAVFDLRVSKWTLE